jgi:two-component system, NarL family, nitrate/nitrite sensor histidine kinase NarX
MWTRQDEFGQVAAGFNRMAATLQSLYGGLEAKVVAKTQSHRGAARAAGGAVRGQRLPGRANTIEELSRGFSQRVREVMKADAVAVRWSDEANQRYLMLASDCFPQDMQDEERSLIAGACACGNLSARCAHPGHPDPLPTTKRRCATARVPATKTW